MKLNLGCSDDRKPGYIGVDIASGPGVDEVADLNNRWPWEDSSVDEIFAHDVFEHLNNVQKTWIAGFPVTLHRNGKIWAMNEAHRVLKPGGLLDMTVPCVYLSDGHINPGAFADPTHATYWTWDDIFYFGEQFNTPEFERGRLGPAYGITARFAAPTMVRNSRGWHSILPGAKDAGLEWKLVETGSGQERRSKIVAKLKAVK